MKPSQITVVGAWEPDTRHREMGVLIAAGYSRLRASQISGVPWRTQERWWAEQPEYRAWIADQRRELLMKQGARLANLFEKCQDITERVSDGSLSPTDPLAEWAERILSRTLFPAFVARMGGK